MKGLSKLMLVVKSTSPVKLTSFCLNLCSICLLLLNIANGFGFLLLYCVDRCMKRKCEEGQGINWFAS